MQILLSLINFLIPPATDCYLSHDVLDPRTDPQLKQVSIHIAQETGIGTNQAMQYLSCSKKNTYTAKRTASKSKPSSAFCQFNKRLVDPYRVKKGAEFYKRNQQTLMSASKEFQVDPLIITAIIGVESNYGAFSGTHLVKDSIATVVANTCQNATKDSYSNTGVSNKHQFFVRELKSLIIMNIKHGINIDALQGSWDGGIGMAQFMPYSYLNYAYSPNRETPDLHIADDAIFSVANYLAKTGGWTQDTTAVQYQPSSEEVRALANQTAIPYGNDTNQHIYRFTLDDGSQSYWLTGPNFETIRQYNPRPHYAINVHLLAEEIRDNIKSESK